MALILKDRVQETSTTTGTGTLTLAGAVTQFQTFSSAIGNGNTTYYTIYNAGGTQWEVGLGTVGAGTLSRDTVFSSSNAGSLVSFTGTLYVFCDYPAATSIISSNNDSGTAGQVLKNNGVGNAPSWQNATNGTVTSVGVTSSAGSLAITNSPITSSGNIGVNFSGIASQYVRGDGSLANFPTTTGGGSSVSYYLNGGTNQGTFGGNTYYQMNKTPVIGSPATFSIATNGYIAQFITDTSDPSQLAVPGGNWNFEMYFSASSGGGSPTFYVELYKYNGSTFTLIATGSPETITSGTAVDLYLAALAVPQTTLALTDRLAVRVYVNNDGRTITLHTQDGTLCQVVTTFSTGLTALNGLTAQVQYFATGTTGTDFTISSATDTHTFNIPSASASNRGLLTSTDWTTFNNKGSGTVTSVSATAGTGITVSGSPITSSGTLTITNSLPMVYPGAGIPNSTGSAWGTSYTTSGSGTVVALATNPTITNYTETLFAPSAGSSFTVDLANGTVQRLSLNANGTITLPSSVAGKSFVLIVTYSGAFTLTWAGGSTIKWPGGTVPTASSANGKFDIFTFFQDGTNTYGNSFGLNY